MTFGCSAPKAILFVDLEIAGDGLDWPAVPCHYWLSRQATGSKLTQLKYLPICRKSTNFESKLSGRGSYVVGKQQNAQILVYLHVTYVTRCTSSKAKILGLQNL